VPTVWLASYAGEIKSKPDGATLVALMNAASVPGLLGFGYLSDKLPTRLIIFMTAGGAALASIFLWGFAGRSSALLVVFTLVFGSTGLAFTALWSQLITIVSRTSTFRPRGQGALRH
jgi:MFS family permease